MNPDEPLSDNRPYTMAASFLEHHKLAEVEWLGDRKGYARVSAVNPTKLRHFLEDFYIHKSFSYSTVRPEMVRSSVTKFLNRQFYFDGNGKDKPLRVTGGMVNDVIHQLRALCQVNVDRMPAWLDNSDGGLPEPHNVVAFENGLLDVSDCDIPLISPTPNWFSQTVLPRAYDPSAKCPMTLKFFRDLLVSDDQIALLQEWLGYLLTQDTSMQKLLMLLGIPGAGKGTLMRLMTDLIGKPSTVTFKLVDLQKEFTLSAWLGKSLAICREAVLSNHADAHQVIEEILAIAGEDDRFVNVKNKNPLPNERMNARMVLAMNGFPQLPAAGNQLRRRSLILSFDRMPATVDAHLYDKLKLELPGLTAWAMEGLHRLRANGVFTVTSRSADLLDRLCRLASPVRSFGEDCLSIVPEQYDEAGRPMTRPRELKRIVYEAWRAWQQEHGHKAMSFNSFFEKLYEAFPSVRSVRAASGTARVHCLEGVELCDDVLEKIPTDKKSMTSAEMDVRQGRLEAA